MDNDGRTPPVTAKQQKALEEFRQRISDLLKPEHDDHHLRKWLKARGYDVGKAEKMFRDSIAFREKSRPERLLHDYTPPKVIREYLTGGFTGFDLEGSPVRVEPFGNLDLRGLMCSCKKSDLEKAKILQCEQTVYQWNEQTRRLGRKIDGLTVVFDMENTGTRHLWRPGMQMYLALVKILEDNYPEMLKQLFVVNAPRILPMLWKLGRPLISEDTKKKIHILGSDYIKDLVKYIAPDQIPAYLGGTQTDPDGNPRCETTICHGGIVPLSYYLSQIEEDMEVVSIPKGDKLKIDVRVDNIGSLLRWEFRSVDYDVGFGVVFLEGGKEKELIPIKRVNAHQLAQDGSVTCEIAGTYIIVFDNSYSWAREKTVHYLAELHTNDDLTSLEVDDLSGGSWTRLSKDVQITHL